MTSKVLPDFFGGGASEHRAWIIRPGN